MWVVSRQVGESIMVADDVILTVVSVQDEGQNVRLGVTAPPSFSVELHENAGTHEPARPASELE